MDYSIPTTTQGMSSVLQGMPSVSNRNQIRKGLAAPESKAGFYLVLMYLFFDFGRPQAFIPPLSAIPFGTGLSILIFLNAVRSGKIDFSRLHTKLWLPLFAVMAIHVLIATNNYKALMTLKEMIILYAVYIGISVFVDSTEKMMTVIKVWLGIHAFLAIFSIFQGGTGLAGSWMGDENDFCMVMNMVVPFAYFLLFSVTSAVHKVKYLTFLGTFLLAVMATLSRGGFIGLAAVGAYCWYRSPRKGAALVVLLVTMGFMLLFAPPTYWDEIASSTSDETMSEKGTGGGRLYTWGIGMRMFYANPIIGIGQGNFPWVFDVYEAGDTLNQRSLAGHAAHSVWVTVASELGLVGIVTIGGLIVCAFLDLRWVRRKFSPRGARNEYAQIVRQGENVRMYMATAIEGSLIGFIFSGVFISVLWYPSLWIMLAFAAALRNISKNNS